ncbi:hypothetical protein SK128_007297 [Halocaridina rubra]|uniref:Uncharacterized protein n=1 Tax=Halocaridina rubra TaxID=373956 RepID=A0AAN8X6U1_HALRR
MRVKTLLEPLKASKDIERTRTGNTGHNGPSSLWGSTMLYVIHLYSQEGVVPNRTSKIGSFEKYTTTLDNKLAVFKYIRDKLVSSLDHK